jgi:hypothetical protein
MFFPGLHLFVIVAVYREADLREPVTKWLRDGGFQVRLEVPILSRRADLVAARAGLVTAIEMKLHDWAQALRQAMAYQIAANCAWVAMPLAAACRAYRERWRFEAEGVGLLAVDDHGHVRVPILAGPSPRLLPFVQEKVLEIWRAEGPHTWPAVPSSNPALYFADFPGRRRRRKTVAATRTSPIPMATPRIRRVSPGRTGAADGTVIEDSAENGDSRPAASMDVTT